MRKLFLIAILLWTSSTFAAELSLYDLPDSPQLLADTDFSFKSLKTAKKKVVLDLWASWCEPCKESLPKLLSLQKSNPQIQVILINEDSDKSDALEFLKTFPELKELVLVFDRKMPIAKALKVEAIPSSFVFDESGKLLERHRGYHKDTLNKLEKALKIKN